MQLKLPWQISAGGISLPPQIHPLSCLRRVPPELLCEICRLTLPWGRRIEGIDLHQSPWPLGLVCQSWRRAAITYPALWRVLELTIPKDVPTTDIYPVSMLETTLLRSANLPLDLTFRQLSSDSGAGGLVDPAWVDSLVQHCRRSDTIHISYCAASTALLDIFGRVTGQLLAFRKLELVGTSTAEDFASDLAQCFSDAPTLREVLLTTLN
ncbi:hypothetical protein FB451DRAFT_1500456 [Mycena latifolia]|nr:hypothetical protein FB451DRAFT_1500456 [Mycena latifolia]